jgi:hypothetical protein
MGYESKSIKKIISEIEESKVYLPALQRKFVWDKHRIQLLFDSIMRNFPIGTFLFWKLQRLKADTYVFYEFLKEYDQRDPYNRRKTGSFLHPEITGILDGQQRLSSMYIGLQGTHTEKAPYKRTNNDDAYKKTNLYINVLSLPYYLTEKNSIATKEEQNFEFVFLTQRDSENYITRKIRSEDETGCEFEKEESMYWFKVGEVLSWDEDPEFDEIVNKFILNHKNESQKNELISSRRFIKKCLETLHTRITKEELINYFEISKDELEDILKIFIRVNSGGMQLSKTDLLFSTIVATWNNGREEIEELLKKINNKNEKFNFTNEYLMRCCLVLTDAPVLYKVNSFKADNVEKIKKEWGKIAEAISKTVDLLVEFGFSGALLTSQNATIIIAYYLYKGGNLSNDSKISIKKYLIHSLLNGIYGSSQDQIIAFLRNAFRIEIKHDNGEVEYKAKYLSFSFDVLLKLNLPSRKSLYISDTVLDKFLTYKKSASSFFVLTLIYPNLRYKEVQFHQDHIHPFANFNKETFDKFLLSEEQRKEWLDYRDMIPNLQLLEGRLNESKNATEFKVWIGQKDKNERDLFFLSNYIPLENDLEFISFMHFFELRKTMLKAELKKVLAINNELSMPEELIEETVDILEETEDVITNFD